ncbi:MAG: helix-turn-helix transcriptional regulator [Candidatus Hodarchaeales archaeon]|jgi:predicted ArsR family transcriptional regulator
MKLEIDKILSSKDKILQYLLLSGSTVEGARTVKEIAEVLEISINATRQYLIVLEKEGLVTRTQKKSITGRPAILYSLVPSAIEAFPKTYKDFSVKLLAEIQERIGDNATEDLLKEVGKQIADEVMPRVKELIEDGGSFDSLRDRLNSIVKVYEEYGKYPELLEDESSFALKNYNCLIFGVAQQNPLACAVDETIVSELSGVSAFKEKCIRNGDECCLYRIKKSDVKAKG